MAPRFMFDNRIDSVPANAELAGKIGSIHRGCCMQTPDLLNLINGQVAAVNAFASRAKALTQVRPVQVFPRAVAHDAANRGGGHTEFLRQKFQCNRAGRISRADLNDITFLESRHSVPLTKDSSGCIVLPRARFRWRIFLPSLALSQHHIPNILSLRARHKMIWATTEFHIASVADHLPRRNLAIGQVIGKAVGTDLQPPLIAEGNVIQSIPITGDAAGPQPAAVWAIAVNAIPESILLCLGNPRDRLKTHRIAPINRVPRPGLFAQRRDILVFTPFYRTEAA